MNTRIVFSNVLKDVFSRKITLLVRTCCMDLYNWDHISALSTCTLYLFSPKILDQGCSYMPPLVQWVPIPKPQMTLHGYKLTCRCQAIIDFRAKCWLHPHNLYFMILMPGYSWKSKQNSIFHNDNIIICSVGMEEFLLTFIGTDGGKCCFVFV